MMKYFLILNLIYLVSCKAASRIPDEECIENLNFKDSLMNCINNIESYTFDKLNKNNQHVNLAEFKNDLKMISKYTEVNYSLLGNYVYGYADKEAFKKEKQNWLNWYENNKCKNLKWNEQ